MRLVLVGLAAFGSCAAECGPDHGYNKGPADAPPAPCGPDKTSECARRGQLCEASANGGELCVDPWQYGSPTWPRCENAPRATAESLSAKAAIYDARVESLHMHPRMPWVVDVVLEPGVDPETAIASDVAAWWSGENDGLFSGLVFAAEAYRYGATGDARVLSLLDRFMDGEEQRMRITGVRGLFARQIIPPGIEGLACPTDLAEYTPAPDKRGNRWVRIGSDGCAQIVPEGTGAFVSTSHCGLADLAGWCFKDNPSQDEYVGHAVALNALARVLHDRALQGSTTAEEIILGNRVQDMRNQIHRHLAEHGNVFVDWDGRETQWGKLYPGAPGDTRGYLAVVGLGVQSMGVLDRTLDYTPPFWQSREDWAVELDEIDQWTGPDGCEANWNNLSMLTASFHETINWPLELDTVYRGAFAASLEQPTQTTRTILAQHNAWWELLWALGKPLGPGTDGPAYAAVEDAICQLKQFPRSNHQVARDTSVLAPNACTDRLGNSLAAQPFEIADRCAATFAYWGNPYERHQCDDRHELVRQPGGYLLPYWMGRYFGFIAADL